MMVPQVSGGKSSLDYSVWEPEVLTLNAGMILVCRKQLPALEPVQNREANNIPLFNSALVILITKSSLLIYLL